MATEIEAGAAEAADAAQNGASAPDAGGATEKNIIQTVHDTLWDEMKGDDRVVILGEDVGARGGVFRATAGFLEEFGDQRVIDTPLAESGIVGVAIGMALHGLLPVAEIQFADFIHPAFDQIVSEAARIRYRSNGDFGVPLVMRAPYGGGVHGALYHSQSIEAFYGHVPGLKVVVPSTPYDVKGMLRAAIKDPDPVLFLEHKKTYRLIKGDVPDGPYEVPIGTANVKREGSDLTCVAYGLMLHVALAVAERMAGEGVSVEVVDVRTISPLDKETILSSVRKTAKAFVLYEDNRTYGAGAEISATIAEECMFDLDAPVVRMAGPDIPAMPFAGSLEHVYMPDEERVYTKMKELADF
jgi:2-oxoisovalerate dehydrogenase E1 component beta subunit